MISHVGHHLNASSAVALSAILAFSLTFKAYSDDPVPLERIATIPSKGTAGTLDHLFVDSASSRLYLANEINNTLDVIDVKNNQLVKQVYAQNTIHGVVCVPSLDRIFTGVGQGACNVLDAKSFSPIKSIPVPDADSVRFDPRTTHVFVTSEKSLTVIDAKSLELISTIQLPGEPHGFQVAKKRSRVFVNTSSPNQVAVIDSEKNELIAKYPLAGDSKSIGPLALDEDNSRLLVGLRAKPRLVVLNIDSGQEIATLPIPETADDMYYDPDLKRIFISCKAGFIAVIRQVDADHYESITNLPTAQDAKTSWYDPLLKRLYVAVPRRAGKEVPEIWVYQAKR